MSYRTLVELNHDFAPGLDPVKLAKWAYQMEIYLRSGDKKQLPPGVTFKHRRHHSDPDPMEGHGDPS